MPFLRNQERHFYFNEVKSLVIRNYTLQSRDTWYNIHFGLSKIPIPYTKYLVR